MNACAFFFRYAYVNFQHAQDASRAIELLNFTTINGKAIRTSYSQRDPSVRKSGVGNIIVQNLDKSIDNKTLHDTFSRFGNIVSAKVAEDNMGNSRGLGYVQFDNAQSAQSAIENVNGMEIAGKTVYVGQFKRRSERQGGKDRFTNVFVKNFGDQMDEDRMKEVFSAYGEITSVHVPKDDQGNAKGFGFVNFKDPDAAKEAVEKENGREENGFEWYVGRHQKRAEREQELKQKHEQERRDTQERYQGRNLYVKNLADDIDDDRLRELFSSNGTVTSCRVMRDSYGTSRGFGFVAFSTGEEAMKAVTEMNSKLVHGKPLYVALSQKREERQRMLNQKFSQPNAFMANPAAQPGGVPPNVMTQNFYHPGIMPTPQGTAVPAGMQTVMPPHNMRPGTPQMMPGYMMQPHGAQAGRGQGGRGRGRMGGRGGGPRGAHQGNVRYSPAARNVDASSAFLPPEAAVAQAPAQAQAQAQAPVPDHQPPPPPHAQQRHGGPPRQQAQQPPQERSNATELATQLANAPSTEEQTRLLGEALYPHVEAAVDSKKAPKITGMLLEMDQSEVLHLLESPDALQAKVAEAIQVLEQANANPE